MKINEIMNKDFEMVCNSKYIDFGKFDNATVLITGATGLIGYTLTKMLLGYAEKTSNGLKVIALVRNIEKAKKMYSDFSEENLKFVVSDITEKIDIEDDIDYIIHGASQTSSKAFVGEPVETIFTAINGTTNMLELAKEKKVKSFVYLSSMEVYGAPLTDEKITEEHSCNLDTMSVRTSYPESKRMCESLCTAYYNEYGVPTKVIRLTQTFGPGVSYNDGRVFADFARCAIEGRDIILHTKGETKRNYLYTADAVTAILAVLLSDKNGEAYNAANEGTYCSIFEMAELVANKCSEKNISVKIEIDDESKFGFAPTLKMNLDTSKLNNIGWSAITSLEEMFTKLIICMEEEK